MKIEVWWAGVTGLAVARRAEADVMGGALDSQWASVVDEALDCFAARWAARNDGVVVWASCGTRGGGDCDVPVGI